MAPRSFEETKAVGRSGPVRICSTGASRSSRSSARSQWKTIGVRPARRHRLAIAGLACAIGGVLDDRIGAIGDPLMAEPDQMLGGEPARRARRRRETTSPHSAEQVTKTAGTRPSSRALGRVEPPA